ncbi:MAG TPA: alpha/beta fold hydrolase [Candidatus Hydrogenedentes bacterium]|nr:alpha/beta fold hydrolase [Candidatus Hydrogenedentota bacterium]HOV73607.1 alpha/beta fold hydrolase [Candidatus Hydrogenedentota bacterium]
MALVALHSTEWLKNTGDKIVRAAVHIHQREALRPEQDAILVSNRQGRLESLLIPFLFQKHLKRSVGVLAEDRLLVGRIGAYLQSHAITLSPRPDRDEDIVPSLLNGGGLWLSLMRDTSGKNGTPHVPVAHTEPAMLALRAAFLRRLAMREGTSEGDADAKRQTVIVPVNVSYYPPHGVTELFVWLGAAVARKGNGADLGDLPVSGTVLGADAEIHLTLGLPIDVESFIGTPEWNEVFTGGILRFDAMESDPQSLVSETARRIKRRYDADVHLLAMLHPLHILAGLLRSEWRSTFTDRAFRLRAYLCAMRAEAETAGPLHGDYRTTFDAIIRGIASPQYEAFMAGCVERGLLRLENGLYRRVKELPVFADQALAPYFETIDPMPAIVRLMRHAAWTPNALVRREVRLLLTSEDQRSFERDYAATYEDGVTKPIEVGRPFLLRPWRPAKAAIVLIHGYMAAPLELRAMAEFLRGKGYAVYAVRMKGHGTSPADLATTTWHDWYASIERACAIAATLSDRVVVGGFSMGAGMALLTAARRPETTSAVFAIDAPLHLRNSSAKYAPSIVKMNAWMKRFHWNRFRWEYVENHPENRHINYTTNPVATVAELTTAMNIMADSLKKISSPALVIQGSRDPIVHPDSGPAVFDKIGTTRKMLYILERDRHGIVNGEGSREVFEHVALFLSQALRKE